MKQILLILFTVLFTAILTVFLTGGNSGAEAQIGIAVIEYRYDAVHDVSIWTYRSGSGAGIAVLPGEKVSNKGLPMIEGVQ